MKYFAYGSNMSTARLRARVPSATWLGCFTLAKHDLRFHKAGKDGSGKCNIYQTGNQEDQVIGALFEIDENEKTNLDRIEGGYGYKIKMVHIYNDQGDSYSAFTYYVTENNPELQPYDWYMNHVLIGAKETGVPAHYLAKIASISCIEDPDKDRAAQQHAIYQ